MKLTPEIARMIIQRFEESGHAPEFGFEHFSSGFEDIVEPLEDEYLKEVIKKNGSTFKLISGSYGTGKTHLTKHFREIAWTYNYATCYVDLEAKNFQFHKILSVYQKICLRIQRPVSDKEKIKILDGSGFRLENGLASMIRYWYYEKQKAFEIMYKEEWKIYLKKYIDTIRGFDSIYFGRVIREMLKSLIYEDEETFEDLQLWFEGGGNNRYKEFGIKKQIETDTFRMMSSLTKLLTNFMGFAGIILIFDEGEREILKSREKDMQMNTLRQIIDKCGDQSIPNMMFLYTVVDENEFLNPSNGAYDAIKGRLDKYFSLEHPMHPKINLDNLYPTDEEIIENLTEIGRKVSQLFRTGYNFEITGKLEGSISNVVAAVIAQKYGAVGARRLLVQTMCQAIRVLLAGQKDEIDNDDANSMVGTINKKLTDDDDDEDEAYA